MRLSACRTKWPVWSLRSTKVKRPSAQRIEGNDQNSKRQGAGDGNACARYEGRSNSYGGEVEQLECKIDDLDIKVAEIPSRPKLRSGCL